ncbi:hypothetical protein DN402_24815 [Streptomyces sp. SW4]|nr:hypothetical protein DN402_24815 [Streptomyces sp. SW4]
MVGWGGPDSGHLMTVRVTHGDAVSEYEVLSAAAPAYTQEEVQLSHRLLGRFVTGEASPSALVGWWRSTGRRSTPGAAEREEVLAQLLAGRIAT